MMWTFLGIFILSYVRLEANADTGNQNSADCTTSDGDEEALFLTPFIEDENRPRQEIRNMARVNISKFEDVESFAGYLTVNKTYNSNYFFWYFPAEVNQTSAPIILWVSGGPGASSSFALFTELGPFKVDENLRLSKRNYSWSRYHNVIFIDAPEGAGFSFADEEAGYCRNKEATAVSLHEALIQLYELFEWKESLDFWICGESYGGKIVVALAYQIHKAQAANKTRMHIPLKGLASGNGFVDPKNFLSRGDYIYQLGLIDEHGLAQFHDMEQKIREYIEERKMDLAFDWFDNLILSTYNNHTLFHNLTGYNYAFNYLIIEDTNDIYGKYVNRLMNCSSIRKALRVGRSKFTSLNFEVLQRHKLDFMSSVAPQLSELLEHYTVCLYSGQLDVVAAYTIVRNFLKTLNFSAAEEYKIAQRQIWYEDEEIAGYTKKAGNLIDVMVRNAGHEAIQDQPKWMHNLIYKLTRNTL